MTPRRSPALPRRVACVYFPVVTGGAFRYLAELAVALTEEGANDSYSFHFVSLRHPTSKDARFQVATIADPPRERETMRTTIGWLASRLWYYQLRERSFQAWLERHPDVNIVHIHAYAPWLAARH